MIIPVTLATVYIYIYINDLDNIKYYYNKYRSILYLCDFSYLKRKIM